MLSLSHRNTHSELGGEGGVGTTGQIRCPPPIPPPSSLGSRLRQAQTPRGQLTTTTGPRAPCASGLGVVYSLPVAPLVPPRCRSGPGRGIRMSSVAKLPALADAGSCKYYVSLCSARSRGLEIDQPSSEGTWAVGMHGWADRYLHLQSTPWRRSRCVYVCMRMYPDGDADGPQSRHTLNAAIPISSAGVPGSEGGGGRDDVRAAAARSQTNLVLM